MNTTCISRGAKSANATSKKESARLDKIFSDFEAQPAVITHEQLEEIDGMERSLEFVIRPRRAALLSLTMSGKELTERVQRSRDEAKLVV